MSTVELAETARLVWREELVLGRSGEAPGRVRTGLRVRRAGRALLSQDLAAGPDADGWAGAAVFGGNRTVGSVLVVDPRWTPTPPDARTVVDGALMPLTGPAMLATAVAPDAHTLRARLAALAPTDTTQQQVVHSIEMNEDCTGHRPANQAGRA
jgi:urease accessory protein